jgi:hypothetical protein
MSLSTTTTTNILDNIIRKSVGFSLSSNDLLEICENETIIVPYSRLKDINDLSEVLDQFDNFIVFYETTSKHVGHYSCVIYHRNKKILEFFDSYGQTDATLLGYSRTSYNFSRGEMTLSYLMQQFCLNNGARQIINSVQLQSADFEDVSTCGRYVGIRIRFRYLQLSQFIKLIRSSKIEPDYLVTLMTFLYHDLPQYNV